MAERHAERQRQEAVRAKAVDDAHRAELLRDVVVAPAQPGESEPNTWDMRHLGHRSHMCLGIENLCQCGASMGLACFVMPSEPVVMHCPVCEHHGLPRGVPWLYEPVD